MKKSKNSSGGLGEILNKLQQVNHELERMHFSAQPDNEILSLSDDEELKTAKSLLFIWSSRLSFLDPALVADPGWLILLNLKISELMHTNLQVSTVCIDSKSPGTTALRWIKLLESEGLVKVEADPLDRRRKFVRLTDKSSETMSRYLQNIRNFVNNRWMIF